MSRGDNDQIYHDQFVPPPDNVGAASPSGDDSDKSSYNSFEVYDDDDEYIDSDLLHYYSTTAVTATSTSPGLV